MQKDFTARGNEEFFTRNGITIEIYNHKGEMVEAIRTQGNKTVKLLRLNQCNYSEGKAEKVHYDVLIPQQA